MSDKHITEILPDLDKMPDWAREAFEAGQFFNVAFKRVEELEWLIDQIRIDLRAYSKGTYSANYFIRLVHERINQEGSDETL